LLNRIQSHQLAHNRPAIRCTTRCNREPWMQRILETESHPLRQMALKTDMAMIEYYDELIRLLEAKLLSLGKEHSIREFTLLLSVPGIGENLGLTILHEIGDIDR